MLPLSQFAGEGGKGLGSLCAIFVLTSFSFKFYELFPQIKAKNFSFLQSFNKIDLSICFLILSALIATVSSYFLKESLSGFIKYFLYFLIYISFVFCLKNRQSVYLLIGASLVGCFWVCWEGLNQVLFGAEQLATWEDPNLHPSQRLNRIYSTLLNPNLLSAYLIALWPLLLPFIFKNFSKLKLLIIGFAALLLVYLTFQTGSRGAWLALAGQFGLIGLILIIFYRNPFVISSFIGMSIAAFFYILSKAAILNRLISIFSSYDHSSNSFRLHVWQACLRLIADNPIFGIGVGSKAFYLAYAIYMDANYSALGAYSLFLEISVEMGLIGLAAFLYLIFIIAQKGIQAIQKLHKSSEDFVMILAILISLMGLLIDSLFDIVILRPQVQILLWLIVAIFRFYSIQIIHNENN